MTDVIVDIQAIKENGNWFVRLCSDGHEIDRWGPFSESEAMKLTNMAVDQAKQFAVTEG